VTEQLAIDGGKPVRTEPFPAWPIWGKREEEELLNVLHSGHWGETSGQVTARFIRQFAAFQDAEYGVPVTNGTIALEVALSALGVGFGDEVITTAYTFIATASSAFAVGAKPVFVDIDPATNNIDPAKIEAAITPRTKVIVPVHIGGHPADMDGILEIARKHGLKVLEDAAQAWGAQWKGRGVGSIGDLGTFSFQSSKNITAGEGGAVLTNNHELYEMVWSLHNVGRLPEGGWYHHVNLGRNLRLSEFQSAVLTAQLERLPEQTETRNRNAWRLIELLEKIPGITPIKPHPNATRSSWHIFQLRYDTTAFGGRDRDQFLEALRAEGVPCSAGYVPLIHAPAIRNTLVERFGQESLDNLQDVPHADAAGRTTVWMTQTMLLGTDEDMQQIAEAIAKIQRAWGA
jgi:dTDP-4-amino-4,6-dideoxygalactose transaminase